MVVFAFKVNKKISELLKNCRYDSKKKSYFENADFIGIRFSVVLHKKNSNILCYMAYVIWS